MRRRKGHGVRLFAISASREQGQKGEAEASVVRSAIWARARLAATSHRCAMKDWLEDSGVGPFVWRFAFLIFLRSGLIMKWSLSAAFDVKYCIENMNMCCGRMTRSVSLVLTVILLHQAYADMSQDAVVKQKSIQWNRNQLEILCDACMGVNQEGKWSE